MENVFNILDKHNIKYSKYDHIAIFTTEEGEQIDKDIPGKHCKNLFLTNKNKTKYFLVTLDKDKKADLEKISEFLNEKRLRFASPEDLNNYLGVNPGSVSPLGLINDIGHSVLFLIDQDLMNEEIICIHPNINTSTISMKVKDFERLINELGYFINKIQI